MKLEFKDFPTHIAKTNNKKAPNKMLKINNQAIYNGYINRFARNTVINNMQGWIDMQIPSSTPPISEYPVKIRFVIYTVRNHGSISLRKGKLCWKEPEEDYEPNWDIENLASIWIKTITDVLTKRGIIPDDSVQYVNNIEYKFREVKDLTKRKIEVTIK